MLKYVLPLAMVFFAVSCGENVPDKTLAKQAEPNLVSERWKPGPEMDEDWRRRNAEQEKTKYLADLELPTEEIVTSNYWYIGDFVELAFKESRYSIQCREGELLVYCSGVFKISEDEITLFYPDTFVDGGYPNNVDLLFEKEGECATLMFEREYIDLNHYFRLRAGDRSLFCWKFTSPTLGKYVVDGLEVINDGKYILLLENTRLRKQPRSSASLAMTCFAGLYQRDEYNLDKVVSTAIAHSVFYSDAHTTEIFTIDGVSGPWYRIAINGYPYQLDTEYAWVFGGYAREINREDFLNLSNEFSYYASFIPDLLRK